MSIFSVFKSNQAKIAEQEQKILDLQNQIDALKASEKVLDKKIDERQKRIDDLKRHEENLAHAVKIKIASLMALSRKRESKSKK